MPVLDWLVFTHDCRLQFIAQMHASNLGFQGVVHPGSRNKNTLGQ